LFGKDTTKLEGATAIGADVTVTKATLPFDSFSKGGGVEAVSANGGFEAVSANGGVEAVSANVGGWDTSKLEGWGSSTSTGAGAVIAQATVGQQSRVSQNPFAENSGWDVSQLEGWGTTTAAKITPDIALTSTTAEYPPTVCGGSAVSETQAHAEAALTSDTAVSDIMSMLAVDRSGSSSTGASDESTLVEADINKAEVANHPAPALPRAWFVPHYLDVFWVRLTHSEHLMSRYF
jgi:hypothetical protein